MIASRWRRQCGRAFPVFIMVLAIAAMAAGVWLSARFDRAGEPPKLQSGTLLQPAKALADFQLQDQNRKPFTPQSLRGQWSLLFFGYSHCPDICPNTLAVLNTTLKELPEGLRKQTRVVFVSVDPQRDTPPELSRYLAYFNPAFIGATGAPAQLDALTRSLGVLYVHNAPDKNGDYSVDHSAGVFVIDPEGKWIGLFSNLPHDATSMAQDLDTIRNYHEENS